MGGGSVGVGDLFAAVFGACGQVAFDADAGVHSLHADAIRAFESEGVGVDSQTDTLAGVAL